MAVFKPSRHRNNFLPANQPLRREEIFTSMLRFIGYLFFSFLVIPATAQIRLPKLISNGMVLQRDEPVRIWGWSSPKEKITVQVAGKKLKTTANDKGEWFVILPPQKAGGPFDIKLNGKNEIVLTDVLFGDVWLGCGQSNMVTPMERVKEKYPADIASANYPQIRNFFVPTVANLQGPQADLPNGEWKKANPTDVLSFGAVSYFFARQLYERYKIPIGIINSSVGGTPAEAWISAEGLKPFPDLIAVAEKNKDSAYVNQRNRVRPPAKVEDMGMDGSVKWYDPAYTPKGWRNINIPGYWEDQGLNNLNGIVWYRREIEIPETMNGKAAKLYMGRIVDADEMWLNGKRIGNITYQYPPRRYEVPAGLLKTGKNILVIRVSNFSGKGGFVPDKHYELAAEHMSVDLKGTWQYKVGAAFKPVIGSEPPPLNLSYQPTASFNAMLAPIVPYNLKGFLWYQGESNAGNPGNYDKLIAALIADWREKWKKPSAPVLFVQLPNFMDYSYLPVESNWALLRNLQRKVLATPNTAMAVTTDCGEWNDIHPLNKKDIGDRLALQARRMVYGEDIVSSGPLYERADFTENSVTLHFTSVGSGLITNDAEPLRYFAIAGADKKFVWASAKIEGNNIVVWNKDIKNPKYVRYNWADNPEGNLYNKEGLPASPFETE